MKITADTNLFVRAITEDDPHQAAIAQAELAGAAVVVLTLPAVCELVWVLSRGYAIPVAEIGGAIRRLIDSASVEANRPAIEAGLAMLAAGGDFADGAIAHEGSWLGAEIFVSFDRQTVVLLGRQGVAARLPGVPQAN